jgi:hypothetical protein
VIDMANKKEDNMEKLLELDDVVEDGLYCVAPTEEDLKAFAEHARKRKEAKQKK